jgi:hypothetical protein
MSSIVKIINIDNGRKNRQNGKRVSDFISVFQRSKINGVFYNYFTIGMIVVSCLCCTLSFFMCVNTFRKFV